MPERKKETIKANKPLQGKKVNQNHTYKKLMTKANMPEREIIMTNNIKAMTSKEATTMNNTKGKHRAIKCIENGKTYISIKEAAKELKVCPPNICNVLSGKRDHTGGYTFEYLSEAETKELIASMEPKEITIQKPAHIRGKGKCTNGNTNAVLCISTGEVYTSCTDAAMNNDTTVGQMSSVCRGRSHTTKGKRFCYVKDINEHLDEVAESIRKANMYDELTTKEEKRKELYEHMKWCENEVCAKQLAVIHAEDELERAKKALETAKIDLLNFNIN